MKFFTRLLSINQRLGIIILQIIIFLSLFTIAKPSLSGVNCQRCPIIDIINPNGSRGKSCLLSKKFNQHGGIYAIGIPRSNNTFTIYRGIGGDAIRETTVFTRVGSYLKRDYGSWRHSGNEFIFQFLSGMKIYMPIEYY